MLALSNNSYINLFHSVYTSGVQDLLESSAKIKTYSVKEHFLSLIKSGVVLGVVNLCHLSIKNLKTDYSSPSEFNDKTYNNLKSIYNKIKDVEKVDEQFLIKSKENFKSNKLINLGLTKHLHYKIDKGLVETMNALHQKAKEIKKIIDMMEEPIQTEFLKQIPFDEIYDSRPDSAECIF